ncbi:hypothetical protein NQ315_005038 [Exocentrus adspersus]|uniref:Uncharacterized protein n=1 Tax=Exocentrus adspersus TaxID=1586481 RepID=A0AAV8VQ43_9CUCU|nr:hypothetical protein NQ315_005038 [Exocentrus adspersus]
MKIAHLITFSVTDKMICIRHQILTFYWYDDITAILWFNCSSIAFIKWDAAWPQSTVSPSSFLKSSVKIAL